jgi:ketosteroid isomerase-like protein
MPSANLDLVRSIYVGWERGDYTDMAWAHPDIELVMEDVPDSGTWRGVAGMLEGWVQFLGAWHEHRVEVEEYVELDGERVLVVARFVAQGKTSGLDLQETRTEGADLFHIRDGKVTRLVVYFDRDRALADLGLEG